MKYAWTLVVALILTAGQLAAQESAAERGHKALTGRAFTPASWSVAAYENLWKLWDRKLTEAPRDYDRLMRERYGLHAAPFENGRYPMGLREGRSLLGKGVTNDCMLCHGGSVLGKSYVGLGNSALDIQALFEDLNEASGRPPKMPMTMCNVRGTNEAGTVAVLLLSFREPDLKVRLKRQDFQLQEDLCEDTPAWWLLKKKKTMYHTGTSDARSVRSIMQFMLTPLNSRAVFDKEEPTFTDIRAYLQSLEPPRYPLPIDEAKAIQGAKLFGEHCSRCHGTYGTRWTYPSKVVPLDVIGTDRARFDGIPHVAGAFYNSSWFAQEAGDGYKMTEPKGYQAPPLDGVWATAPYFHNGSVPTLYDVLNSKGRPRIYTRSYGTGVEDYDAVKVGWKVRLLDRVPDGRTPLERRKIYDTTQRGRHNTGHTFGDVLTDSERWAVIEYLKTL
jgi:mono/diheme cytochrome c family protein